MRSSSFTWHIQAALCRVKTSGPLSSSLGLQTSALPRRNSEPGMGPCTHSQPYSTCLRPLALLSLHQECLFLLCPAKLLLLSHTGLQTLQKAFLGSSPQQPGSGHLSRESTSPPGAWFCPGHLLSCCFQSSPQFLLCNSVVYSAIKKRIGIPVVAQR